MKKVLFIIVLFMGFIINSFAQKSPMKFGKIDKSDLQMTVYEKDTSAAAVVLCDYGRSYFKYTEKHGFKVIFERHTRIKILDKNAYNYADIAIPFYHDGGNRENVINLKAYTYNSENGKMTKDKLSKKAKFTEKRSKYWSSLKFTMPNVKEGSIIEYQYTIESNFVFNFRNWQFQYSIPVIWSEYNAEIPEYFNYNRTLKGYLPLFINEMEKISKEYTFSIEAKYSSSGGNGMSKSEGGIGEFELIATVHKWVAKDVPAFYSEAHMTTDENYVLKMEFELASTKQRHGAIRNYTDTWESIQKNLIQSNYFGQQYSGKLLSGGSSFIKDQIEAINNKYTKPEEKMLAAFEFVKSYMKWDGYNSKYINTSLRKAFKEKSGNVADVNLLLVLMLKKLNIAAVPVVLSTRSHGVIHPLYPTLSKFNYVVAYTLINGKYCFLDATDPLHAINMLPLRCLNGNGRFIGNDNSDWVALYSGKPKRIVSNNDFIISKEGTLTGQSQTSRDNYAALSFRKEFFDATSQDEFIEKIEENCDGLDVTSYAFENLDNVYKPVKSKYEVLINDQIEVMGDMIYFNPMLYDQIKNNPFKLEERTYPVDYGYEVAESYIYKYTIPEGYEVEEKPEDIAMSLPENAARFTYNVSIIGNAVQVMSKFNINKTQFLPDEYQALKNFYNEVIAKHAEQVILKKKAE